jgi:hypothetical protein
MGENAKPHYIVCIIEKGDRYVWQLAGRQWIPLSGEGDLLDVIEAEKVGYCYASEKHARRELANIRVASDRLFKGEGKLEYVLIKKEEK